MKIAIGSDHAGLSLRETLLGWLEVQGHEVEVFGARSKDSYDYPDAVDLLVPKVLSGECDLGVLICGSGIGVSIRANRYQGIRAALCCSPEHAEATRSHNHANVLCLGERFHAPETAVKILETFLSEPEDHDPRHVRRIKKLDAAVK